jgi:hypothetical protein
MVCEQITQSYTVDQEFVIQAADISEALTNLTYLLREDSNDPAKVRLYVELAEDRTRALRELFYTIVAKN